MGKLLACFALLLGVESCELRELLSLCHGFISILLNQYETRQKWKEGEAAVEPESWR